MNPTRHLLRRAGRLLRWLPFLAASAYSTLSSAAAPDGRKPFVIDWSLSPAAIEFSITKQPHIGAAAILGLLAMIAVGRRRMPLALMMTMAIGAAWELGQSTVIGHTARLSDLLPDAVGALLGCAWGYCVLRLLAPAPANGPS
jgi:VanZ family protein